MGDLLLAGCLAFIASLPFPISGVWRVCFGIPVTVLLTFFLKQQRRDFRARDLLRHYQALLAYLSSRLSCGETLERSFWASGPALKGQVGKDSLFGHGLKQIALQIDSHGDLCKAIRIFVREQACASVQPILLVLPLLQKMGGRLDQFVRDSHRMLAEIAALEKEIQAEQSQKLAEALILAFMPFVLSLGMNQMVGEGHDAWMTSWISQLVYGVSYLISCLALIWTLGSRHPRQPADKRHRARIVLKFPGSTALQSRMASGLYAIYCTPGLAGLFRSVHETLADRRDARHRYFLVKFRLMALGLAMTSIWIFSGVIPYLFLPLGPIAASFIHDATLIRSQRSVINRHRLEYPLFLNWLVNLLRTGFSVAKVMQASQTAWAECETESVVGEDLNYFQQQSLGGKPCDWIIEQLAERNPVPELQIFWHNVARFEREGGFELLELLALEARNGYQMLRYGRRQKLEEQNLLLLAPMMLDLLVVMLIAVWPAVGILIR